MQPGNENGWYEWRDEVNKKIEILIDSHIRLEGIVARNSENIDRNTRNIDRLILLVEELFRSRL